MLCFRANTRLHLCSKCVARPYSSGFGHCNFIWLSMLGIFIPSGAVSDKFCPAHSQSRLLPSAQSVQAARPHSKACKKGLHRRQPVCTYMTPTHTALLMRSPGLVMVGLLYHWDSAYFLLIQASIIDSLQSDKEGLNVILRCFIDT